MRRYPSLATGKHVLVDDEDAGDEAGHEPTTAKPLRTLAQSTKIAMRKMKIPATSSARTAAFRRGKKRSELWLL